MIKTDFLITLIIYFRLKNQGNHLIREIKVQDSLIKVQDCLIFITEALTSITSFPQQLTHLKHDQNH